MKHIYLLVLLVVGFGCSKGAKTPEGLINMFVQDMAANEVNRDYFQEHATGAFREEVLALSDEEFDKFTNLDIKKPAVEILTKTCESDKCTISYVVRYDIFKNKKKTFESEIKKIAQVKKEGENWKLLSVTNIKSFYESTEPIDTLKE